MEDKLSVQDSDVDRLINCFQAYYTNDYSYNINSGYKQLKFLNEKQLIKLTKDLKASNELQKLYDNGKITDVIYMFYKWFENLKLGDFMSNGSNDPDISLSSIRSVLTDIITEHALKCGIFKGPGKNNATIFMDKCYWDNAYEITVSKNNRIVKTDDYYTMKYKRK